MLSIFLGIFLKKNVEGDLGEEIAVQKSVIMFLPFEFLLLLPIPILVSLMSFRPGAVPQ